MRARPGLGDSGTRDGFHGEPLGSQPRAAGRRARARGRVGAAGRFSACKVALRAQLLYEIRFVDVITSVPILFMICYLIYRSVVISVIHKYAFFITRVSRLI